MGEILLTFAVEQILERVTSMAKEEIAGVWLLEENLQELSKFAKSIHRQVQEARNNQAANRRPLNPLLVKLQDVLYLAEDVLDEFSYEILRRQIEYQSQLWLRIRGFASPNNPILFSLKMAHKVKKINRSLGDIEKQALREFALTGKAAADPSAVPTDQLNRMTDRKFKKLAPSPTGRKSEVKAIMNMLQGSSSTPSLLTIVCIVGFGGLGKTTLAKMVFHEVEKNIELFDETIWVCVSESFNEKKILKDMLETLDEHAGGLDNLDAILLHLGRKLKNKKFFLVLDDVWEKDGAKCDRLRNHLLDVCNKAGNFVVTATRNSDVAKAMDIKDEHVLSLEGLHDEECWHIIREKCLLQWGGSMPQELEKIGIDVAKKCKGVPLAAEVVGGTLSQKKKNRDAWLKIESSEAWDQIDGGKEIFPVLESSFHHLNPSLKQCFVYCSLFPKDFEYNKEKLIELWMAEGFLHTRSTNPDASVKSMEDVGDECFNGLIVHSFFQEIEMDQGTNIRRCKMHDLLHALATSLSNYKRLSSKHESICIFSRTSNHQHVPSMEELEKHGARNVRCVISKDVDDVAHMFSTFKSLRSLDLSYAGLKELPCVIGSLKHLRFLDISVNGDIKELPMVITKLYNLLTLRMFLCPKIAMLPLEMVNLVRLRHLHFSKPSLKVYKVGQLTELQTLSYFQVRREVGFGIEELKELKQLRGGLTISGLENVRDREEAEGANLKGKKLIDLTLEWDGDTNNNDKNVLEGLLPPPTINSLTIVGYKGVKFSNWVSMGINSSQCQWSELEELALLYCNKCEILPSLGHLPCLKILEVDGLNNIRCIGSEFYGECERGVTLFPALKEFSLKNMRSLEEWGAVVATEGGEDRSVELFPVLEKLQIGNCPRLRSIPLRHLSSLVSVTVKECVDMECVSNEFQILPSLNYLEIKDCRNLVSFSSIQGESLLIIWVLRNVRN